ncbi:MAG: hypothetical protein HDKAJFGB_00555 [Anaerolineae bacterium]|nr:hypothetical protein [Anaerolineae bacterium]
MSKFSAPPDRLPQARAALERHETEEAQGILISIVVDEPHNQDAWLLLANTFDDLERRMECMQRARQMNPNSAQIALAIQELKTHIYQDAFGQPQPETPAAPSAAPAAPQPETPAASQPELAQLLLDAANLFVHATIMTMEPLETRAFGAELVHLVERARHYDALRAHRWANTTGRAALVKYEKALTQLLTNMPHQDPQVLGLREQRQRALDLFK